MFENMQKKFTNMSQKVHKSLHNLLHLQSKQGYAVKTSCHLHLNVSRKDCPALGRICRTIKREGEKKREREYKLKTYQQNQRHL